MKRRKLAALLLVLAMLVSVFPLQVFAEENEGVTVMSLFNGEEEDPGFCDSPVTEVGGDPEYKDVEIAGETSDAVLDVADRLSSAASAVDEDPEEEPVSLGELEFDSEDAGGELSLQASPSITFSVRNVCIAKGATTTVYLYVNYVSGNATINGNVTNGNVCSAYFGEVQGNRIPLVITGKSVGDCAFDFRITQNGRDIASSRLNATVLTSARPSITVSSSSLNIAKNSRATVTVKHNQQGASVYVGWEWSNNNVIGCSWGGWNASKTAFPLYVTGKSSGSASIKVGLYNRFDELLACTYISPVKVYEASNPTISISPSSAQVYTGDTARFRVTVNGVNGRFGLSARVPDNVKGSWKQIADKTFDLYLGSSTPVSGQITVELKNPNGQVLRTVKASLRVVNRASPRIALSKSSIQVANGSREYFLITVYDCQTSYKLRMSWNTGVFKGSFGSTNGNVTTASVLGYAVGSGTLKVYLLRASDEKVLDTKTISVQVTAASRPPMAFGFTNYDTHELWNDFIPLSTCIMMFGNGERAKTVYKKDYGKGGVCFGMSMASALIYHNHTNLGLSNFEGNARSIYNLTSNLRINNPYNYPLERNLREIIEGLHVSQYTSLYDRIEGVSKVAKKIVSELDKGRVVAVGIRGDTANVTDAGHRILAYGYSYPSSNELLVKIYDPNRTSMSTLSFTRSGSSGDYTSWYFANLDWGTGKPHASINCIPLDSIKYIWDIRGGLRMKYFEDDPQPDEHSNLFVTAEKSFELYAYDADNPTSDGILMVRCEDGDVDYLADGVTHIENWGLLPDGSAVDYDMVFYLPIDYYTFKDLTPGDGADAVICDSDYSVSVTTDAAVFDLYADDSSSAVGAMISANEGEVYQVSIGSSVEGEPDSYSYSGTGTGDVVSVSLENGALNTSGVSNAAVSVETAEPEQYYSVYDDHTEGGTVVYDEDRHVDLAAGDSCMARFVPDDGYQIYNVTIDGESLGSIDTYSFVDVSENHQILVDFRRDIAGCSVSVVGFDENKEPMFSVTAPDGTELIPEEDYTCSKLADENGSYVFLAGETSAYTGVLEYSQGSPFTDVAKGKFYYEPVLWAISQDPQITTGVTDTTFMPDRVCTRGHVVTFLWRANGCPEPASMTNTFKDVPNGKYYTKAVLWAAEQGITTGYKDGTFRPDAECSRGQVVTFLWRAKGQPVPTSTTNPFSDVASGQYYTTAVLWALENNITQGRTPTTFGPDDACTRGHVVTFLYRAYA